MSKMKKFVAPELKIKKKPVVKSKNKSSSTPRKRIKNYKAPKPSYYTGRMGLSANLGVGTLGDGSGDGGLAGGGAGGKK